MHSVFGLLRARANRAALGLQSRVEERLRRTGGNEDTNPGMFRVALSALLQTTNLIVGAFGHQEEAPPPDTDPDDR